MALPGFPLKDGPSCFVMVSTDYDMILSIDKNMSESVDERTEGVCCP
jgi:hypothetical protein